MAEVETLQIKRLINQQLFSETYLQELRIQPFSRETICAEKQTLRAWRNAYLDLENGVFLYQYVDSCLSTLGFSHSFHSPSFTLYADSAKAIPVGKCLLVNHISLGCTTKGHHYQANLIKQLRQSSLQWGIVTNGMHWRLCCTDVAAPYEVFLEIDLDKLLDEEDISLYYIFHVLLGKDAFASIITQGRGGHLALDGHLKASEKQIETVQRYLRGRIEPILQSLCLGFVQDELVGTYTRELLNEIYQNAIYLLYRILFLFYAEARDLLPAQQGNYQQIGMACILEEARLYWQKGRENLDPFSLWRRLTHLFVVVDDGDDSVGVRPYNGGLFSDREKPYLKEHKIANAYLASALFELGYIQGKPHAPAGHHQT